MYIRPQRYTKEFVDTRDTFTLSFYPRREKRHALCSLGKVSGRDEDKVKKVGFTPAFTNGNAYFEEAELVLVCRKMSRTPLRPEQFLDETVDGRWYPDKDYHEMYIAEVIDVLVEESAKSRKPPHTGKISVCGGFLISILFLNAFTEAILNLRHTRHLLYAKRTALRQVSRYQIVFLRVPCNFAGIVLPCFL